MEKKKAQYDLKHIQDLIRSGKWVMTLTAKINAWEGFQLDIEGVKAVLLDLTRADFFKSMTTFEDHTLWQDVYHHWINDVQAYIKLQEADGTRSVVIQFKRK